MYPPHRAPRSRRSRGLAAISALALTFVGAAVSLTGTATPAQAAQVTCTPTDGFDECVRFTYSGGNQTFTVPAGVTELDVRVWAAGGGNSLEDQFSNSGHSGGGGGFTVGTVGVTAGDSLTVLVGQRGESGGVANFGGGGAAGNSFVGQTTGGGSGGGRSQVARSGTVLLVASGAGGAGSLDAPGGGGTAGPSAGTPQAGQGGTQTAGGQQGIAGCPSTSPATAGTAGAGGRGLVPQVNTVRAHGGGGGGGYFGGGGGGCLTGGGGPGGGGSGYVNPSVSGSTTAGSAGNAPGNGASGGASNNQYVSGIGRGGVAGGSAAGHGMVVIQYRLATTITTPEPSEPIGPSFTLEGEGAAGNTLTVTDGSTTVCTTTVTASSTWSCAISGLADGPHTLTATETNPADPGQVITPATWTATIDGTAPDPPDIEAPTDGALLATTTPTISGTAEADSTVTVSEGGTTVCTATTDSAGDWTCTPATALAQGAHSITATATDGAGNVSGDSTAVGFTIDSIPPDPPEITAPTDAELVTTTTPTITGTAEADSTVTVSEGGTTVCTATADSAGAWTCTPSAALTEGAHSITATATDPTGNTSDPSSAVSFTVDSIAPDPPVITDPVDGSILTTTTPTIVGTAEPDSTVTVTADFPATPLLSQRTATVCTAVADAAGDWSCTPTDPLPQGEATFTATATDAEGNTSDPSAAVTVTIDSIPPDAPAVTSPTITNDTTPTLTGEGEPGTTLTITDDSGATVCTTTVDTDGTWSCDLTTTLAEGNHAFSLILTDAGGLDSDPTTFVLEIDTTPPDPGTVDPPDPDGNPQPTITGTAEPGSTITITDEDGTLLCTTVVADDGTWTCTVNEELSVGTHTLTVTVTDLAGNTTSYTFEVTITGDGSLSDPSSTHEGRLALTGGGAELTLGALLAGLGAVSVSVAMHRRRTRSARTP